jgi:hypothetical protein
VTANQAIRPATSAGAAGWPGTSHSTTRDSTAAMAARMIRRRRPGEGIVRRSRHWLPSLHLLSRSSQLPHVAGYVRFVTDSGARGTVRQGQRTRVSRSSRFAIFARGGQPGMPGRVWRRPGTTGYAGARLLPVVTRPVRIRCSGEPYRGCLVAACQHRRGQSA